MADNFMVDLDPAWDAAVFSFNIRERRNELTLIDTSQPGGELRIRSFDCALLRVEVAVHRLAIGPNSVGNRQLPGEDHLWGNKESMRLMIRSAH